jgi:cytochrome c-type biogenesis protein CcmF
MLALAVAGLWNAAVLLTLGLAVFVLVANVQEVARGVRAYGRATKRGVLASVAPAAARDRRRFGGYVVHVGVAIAAMAIAVSSSFAHRTDVTLSRVRPRRSPGTRCGTRVSASSGNPSASS